MSDEKPSQMPQRVTNTKKEIDSLADTPSEEEKVNCDSSIPKQHDGTQLSARANDQWHFEEHLRPIINKLQEQKLPSLTSKSSVMWTNLHVRGAGAGVTYQETIGEILKGPVLGVRKLLSYRKAPEKVILHSLDGVVRDGEMLLVLGRPGSGCSTLLKSLAGLTKEYLGWQGEIKYNGVDVDTFKTRFRGDAAYISEVDVHFPHLRVDETLKFASETKTPRLRPEGQSRKDYVSSMTEMFVTGLGLGHILQTKVGDEFVHGISGGERRRVSLAEMLATRASVGYWDNPTRGLDASTSLEFIRMSRTMCTYSRSTAVMALYQAGETLTQEFDKVTVLYLGHQIFFGKVTDARAYFEELGFVCQPRQTTADFLTAVTDPFARRVKPRCQASAPRKPEDFVKLWKESSLYSQLKKDTQQYRVDFDHEQQQLVEYERYQMMLKAKRQRKESIYMIDLRMQLKANLTRAYYRMIRDKRFLMATAFSVIFMGLIQGSLFFNLSDSTSGFFSKSGVLFFSILFNALNTLSEVGTQYAQRPIVERQKNYAMYHPFVDALGSMFAEYPYKIFIIFIFDVIIYFMVGLKQDAGAFFIFWLTTYLVTLAMSAWSRMLAASTKKFETAAGISGISVLLFSVSTGYVIPRTSMHPWFKWISYADPLAYAFEILMANEFHGASAPCAQLIPSGPGYQNASLAYQVCAVTGAKAGKRSVNGDAYIEASFDYYYLHVWRNIGILCAFILGFTFVFAVSTEFNSSFSGKGEFLIFRRGHDPKYIQKVLTEGRTIDDVESQELEVPLTEYKTNTSEVRGLVKSNDVFTWENVCYDISLPDGQTRRLLDDVSGYVKPGTLTALMGESGAGKTTLLNVLAHRVRVGVVGGSALVNGHPPGRSFQRRTGYVQQQDLHLADSTVREALRFSAVLRQPKDVPLQEKYDYVENVIEILEMQDYAEAVIGDPGNGLNVEQRKRTTIGVELVAKPALLLFLDEPTSGLDSQSAYSIVRFLRKLADSGQAILCTIHQPSSVLFEQFNRLLLLKKGGKTVYFGNIGHRSRTVIEYFESNGAFQCPPDANAAEYILDVIGAGATATIDRDWGEIWKKSQDYKQAMEQVQALKQEYASYLNAVSTEEAETESDFAVSWFSQYRKVQSRLYLHYWRNPTYVMGKVVLNVVSGLFIGFTFYKETNSAQGLQNKTFSIFLATILAIPLIQQLQPSLFELSQLYVAREKPSKMYHVSLILRVIHFFGQRADESGDMTVSKERTKYVAKMECRRAPGSQVFVYCWSTFVLSAMLVEIPYNLVTGTLFFIPWYFAVGFYHDWPTGTSTSQRGVYMWLMLMAFEMWFSTFGLAMAALSPNAEVASVLTTVFASFVILFSGVFQPPSQLLSVYQWVYRSSPYNYIISGLMSTAVHGVPVSCAAREINHFSPPPGQTCGEYAGAFAAMVGNLLNPDATSDCQYCRYKDSDEYLKTVGMSYGDRWRNLGFLGVYVLFNMCLAFAFFYLTKVKSWNFNSLAKLKARGSRG